MNGLALEILSHFEHCLGKRRMSVNGLHDHAGGKPCLHGKSDFRDEIGPVGPDDMGSKDLIRLLVGNDFDHPTSPSV